MRVVLDTNVLVSYLLFPNREHAQAVRILVEQHTTLYSEQLIAEFLRVIGRAKLVRYYEPDDVAEFIVWYRRFSELVSVTAEVHVCRDPKDDHVLALALSGAASWIATGDLDLLSLNPFRGIEIARATELAARSRGVGQ